MFKINAVAAQVEAAWAAYPFWAGVRPDWGCFQGLSWFGSGETPHYMRLLQKRGMAAGCHRQPGSIPGDSINHMCS